MTKDKEKAKETTESRRKKTSPEKTIAEMAEEIVTSKKKTRQSESTPSLSLRMFVRGHEPLKKKVNSYFSLNHLELVKKALDDDQIRKLYDSQFGTLLGIGNKIAFSVKFAHFCMSRQIITKKLHEIWVLFGIASVMLLLLYATKNLDGQISLTRDQVEGASQNYAVELFNTIMSLRS